MSRRAYQRLALDERRTSLMEATLACVARHGLDGATVRRITQEAGVTAGLVRHHFGSKDDLIKNAYAYLIGQLTTRASESAAGPGDTAAMQLRRFLVANMTQPNLSEDKVSLWATFIGRVRQDRYFADIHREGYREFLTLLETLIEQVLTDLGIPHGASLCRHHAIALNALVDGLWLEGSLNSGLYGQAILPDLIVEASERLLGLPQGTLSATPIRPETQSDEEQMQSCAMPE